MPSVSQYQNGLGTFCRALCPHCCSLCLDIEHRGIPDTEAGGFLPVQSEQGSLPCHHSRRLATPTPHISLLSEVAGIHSTVLGHA